MAELSLYSLNENKLDKNSAAVAAQSAEKIINEHGTFTIEKSVPSDAIFQYDNATQSSAGLMSSADKTKLDELINPTRTKFGIFENRPTNNPDNPGLIYISTDKQNLMSCDNGTEWINLNETYKVGDIYVTAHGVNPTDFFGYGTWEAYGQGRVLVGLDEDDSDFDNIENEGGEKSVTLDISNLPPHTHSYLQANESHEEPHHYNDGGDRSIGNDVEETTGSTGDGTPHNNLQPYIVVKMWKRIS